MATDVQYRGQGGRLEGLSVVAGAANLLQPDARGNNVHAATLRASHQHYPGMVPAPGEVAGQHPPFHRSVTMDSYGGPKLVQGDYTYHTVRRNLTLSSQILTGLIVPASAAAPPGHRGTIPAMRPSSPSVTNAAAWKAYGSPSARSRSRPPTVPAASHANSNPQVIAAVNGKLPRVHALGGGFKVPRPQSAPGGGAGEDFPPEEPSPRTASALMARRLSSAVAAGTRSGAASPVPLEVDIPDPLGIGKTDSGKVMFEHTLPTDPYGKYIWEEQARKARANMTRHVAAMAAAAAVNGGMAAGHGGSGGGGGGSRPASARRGGGAGSPVPTSPTGAAAAGSGPSMRPRFSSTTIADVHRQGLDYKPQTVMGFAAPDPTEDATLPGPNDPRWAYTRLGRTQVERLQHSLKITDRSSFGRRPASEPSTTHSGDRSPGTRAGAGMHGASTISSPERSWAPRGEGSAPPPPLPPLSEQRSMAQDGRDSSGGGQWSEPAFRARSPSAGSAGGATTLSRPASASHASGHMGRGSGTGMVRPGSAGMVRPGSAGMARPGSGTGTGSAASGRTGSGNGMRPSSASRNGGLAAETSTPPPPAGVRGSSAGRSREAAPNPRVDLRAYLAEEQAAADEDDEEGVTEMLPVGDLYDALSGAGIGILPEEVSQAIGGMVPPEALAARLAEVVAAAAMVAAQQQITEEQQQEVAVLSAAEAAMGALPAAAHAVLSEASTGAASAAAPLPPLPDGQAPRRGSAASGGSGGGGGGDDALQALHGTSAFGRAPNGGRYSGDAFADPAVAAGTGSGAGDGTGYGAWRAGDDGVAADEGGDDAFAGDGAMSEQSGLGLGLGLGVGLSQRPSKGGRPGSARPMSARPTSARPSSAMPARKRSVGSRLGGMGGDWESGAGGGSGAGIMAEDDVGMHVIHEHSEGGAGEEVEA